MNVELMPNERVDDLQIKGYQIIQKTDGFRFGMDAVLLSSFAKVKRGKKVLDLGTGTGIIPILMEAKTAGGHFTGLEIQKEFVEMANRSILMNGQQDKVEVVEGDIKSAASIFGNESFDVITTNPPYMVDSHGKQNVDDKKAIARHERLCTLEDVIVQSKKLLKAGGSFFMVHRTYRLAEVMHLMVKEGIEPKRIRMVHPYVDKEPNIFLIEGKKGGNSRIIVEPPLIVYKEPGVYHEEIYDIYGWKRGE
ncbi:MAG: tRNA1(Val) (adenine(37)-N6)-methyltransferase [Lachnospiraceae bacterium]|nr:tRNA1(Val) (adenine(37)-N6)-methyltransferase [Lachnospiraceae bacterium]